MQMFSLFAVSAAMLAAVGALAAHKPYVRQKLRSPKLWFGIATAAILASFVSGLISDTRGSGTGWQTSFGWPKPWLGRWLKIWVSSSFLRHYDETQILLKSQP